MDKKTKGEQSKDKLIECAAELFLKKGYNATGINEILSITELPKGSFYFYFSSKKELAIEVSKYFEKTTGQWIVNTTEGRSWEDFVKKLTEDMARGVQNNTYFGCPFAVLGMELAFFEPEICKYYYDALKKLIDIFAFVLRFSGIPEDKISILANRAFAVYEGYLTYYRMSKDINTFGRMSDDLIAVYTDSKISMR